MRVLVLAPPLEDVGGVQRYTTTLVRALQDLLGPEHVRRLAVRQAGAAGSDGHASMEAQGHGRLGATVKGRFVGEVLWEAVRWRPDLVICTHVGLAPAGWLVRTFWRCPYWVVAYGIEVWGALPMLKQYALAKANRVLAISAFTRDRLVARHRIPLERVEVLPSTWDDRLSRVHYQETQPTNPQVNGRRIVLTVGRLAAAERYKGHDVVLRAMPAVLTRVPDAVYVIVGDGDDRARLEGLAWQLGLQSHVVFTGRVPDSDLAAFYRASEVFALPAQTVLDDRAPKGEGFGIVFLEAMAFGKPVVGPRVGAPAEFIRHGEHGLLVDPTSPDEVAHALVWLLTHPEEARRMGKAGQAWVQQEFSYERFRDRLAHLLASCL